MDETNWHPRAICPCGWHAWAPFGDIFHVHVDCCPKCGETKPDKLWEPPAKWRIEKWRWRPPVWGGFLWMKLIEPGRWEVHGETPA